MAAGTTTDRISKQNLLLGPGGIQGLCRLESGAIGQLDAIQGRQIKGLATAMADRDGPGAEGGFCGGVALGLRPGCGTFCGLTGGDQGRQGFALEIADIENGNGAVADPAAGDGGGSFSGGLHGFRGARLPAAGMDLGPQDAHRLAALAGDDSELLGLRKAAPERQPSAAQVHPQGEQDRIGTAVAVAGEEIAVVTTPGAIPGPSPGGRALLQQGDQISHQSLFW